MRCLLGGIALLSSSLAPKCTDQVSTSGQLLVFLQNSFFDVLSFRVQVILINSEKSLQPLELHVNHNGQT